MLEALELSQGRRRVPELGPLLRCHDRVREVVARPEDVEQHAGRPPSKFGGRFHGKGRLDAGVDADHDLLDARDLVALGPRPHPGRDGLAVR